MISLPQNPNFRAVSPLPVNGGGRLRAATLFRSEAVLSPLPDEVAQIRRCGIRLVFDLRSAAEMQRAPNQFWAAEGIEHHNLDLLAGFAREQDPWAILRDNPNKAGSEAMMHALYAGMPRAALGHLPQLFDGIAQGGLPVLIHCTAGKDRTGFMVALILATLGIEPAAIEADYMASAGRKTAVAREATRQMARNYAGTEIGDDAIDGLMGVSPSYLAASFAAIETEFGGLENYLMRIGLDPQKRAAFKAGLIE